MIPIFKRLRVAAGLVLRGSTFPFNRVPLGGIQGVDNLDNPYAKSPWVQRAIKLVAGPIAAVPTVFTNDQDEAVEDPDLVKFWKTPARGLTRHDWIEATVGWLKLHGNAFWVMGDEWLVANARPGSLEPFLVARPDRMKAILIGGEINGWTFQDAAGHKHTLLPQQVVQLKLWNPYSDIWGLGELEAAQTAAEADYLAARFNLYLQRNNGDTGPIIVGKDGAIEDDQRQAIINQLREKRELALRGEFAPAFITGDIAIEDAKVRTPDAAFNQTRILNRHEIYIAFGVPPSMADLVAAYSIGAASDRFRLIEDTCMPLSDKIADGVEQVSRRMTKLNISAGFDWDEHSTLQFVRGERLESARKLWDMGAPLAHVNDYLRLGMKPFPGWNVGRLPFNLAPVGTDAGVGEDAAPGTDAGAGDEGEDPVLSIRAAFDARRVAAPPADAASPRADGDNAGDDGEEWQDSRDQRELAQAADHLAKRRPVEKMVHNRIKRLLWAVRKETLGKIAAAKSITGRAVAADFIFDLGAFQRALVGEMRKVSATALDTVGAELFAELGKDDPFTMPPAQVLQFQAARENLLTDVADEVFEDIKGALRSGLEAGDTMDELAGRVRGAFKEISEGRAQVVAQTETGAAYGQGRAAAMQAAGVQWKRWLTSGNPNVRAAHRAANGQTVAVDATFEVGGEALAHPSDPAGSPANIINCHCVAIPVEDPNE